tara:strand:- start:877 stop:1101 length:225 start_codon:yes stop_codon:yes gene_type:complete
MLIAVTLFFTTLISIMFLLIGGLMGYLLKEFVYERNSTYIPTHPEMFDENGQVIADDILAVRFENNIEDVSEDQ